MMLDDFMADFRVVHILSTSMTPPWLLHYTKFHFTWQEKNADFSCLFFHRHFTIFYKNFCEYAEEDCALQSFFSI